MRAVLSRPVEAARRQLNEVVADQLRERIVRGDIAPGERLAEERLAAEFGVSRNPVREAIRRLQAEGFLVIETNRGARVRQATLAEARDLLAVRAAIEDLVVRQAAERAVWADVEELREIVRQGRSAARRRRWADVAEWNTRFHDRLAQASGNTIAAELMARLRHRVTWTYATDAPRRGQASWTDHGEVVEAIATGDVEGASAAMRRHMANADATRLQAN